MPTKFVQVAMDIDIDWDQENPKYRVYVDDELFTERTWIWRSQYLEEMLQIEAVPGRYVIKVELVDPSVGKLKVRNMQILQGPGKLDKHTLEILP
jgi:hypothetical protein